MVSPTIEYARTVRLPIDPQKTRPVATPTPIPSLPREEPVPARDANRFGDGLRLVGGVDALGEALLAEAAVAHLPPTFVST